MTKSEPELTSQQRLKQTEILLATAAKTINELTQKQERNSEAIAQNAEGIKSLGLTLAQTLELFSDSMQVIREMQADVKQMQADVKQMQSEVRGIQTENQRLLRHLFGDDQQQ